MKHFTIHSVTDGYSIRTVGGEAKGCPGSCERGHGFMTANSFCNNFTVNAIFKISRINFNYFLKAAIRAHSVESVALDNLSSPSPFAQMSQSRSTPDPTGIALPRNEFDRSQIEVFLQQSRRKIS